MDKKAVLSIIDDFQSALRRRGVVPGKIILFGSYAQGKQDEWSDIDLVVVSDDFRGKGLWARMEIVAAAIGQLFKPIEAIPVTEEEWEKGDSTITEFAREGELVYSG
jgi:predicted nucleotidyltransferase